MKYCNKLLIVIFCTILIPPTKLYSQESFLWSKDWAISGELGLDYYFGTGSTKFVSIDNNSTADVTVKNIGNGSTTGFDQFITANGSVNYWLVSHNENGDIDYKIGRAHV